MLAAPRSKKCEWISLHLSACFALFLPTGIIFSLTEQSDSPLMETEKSSTDPEAQPDENPTSRPPPHQDRVSDLQVEETLETLRELSSSLASLERRFAARLAQRESASEITNPWDAAVRRFTGSIDLRLDIVENELGEVQEELAQFQEVAREKLNSMERRLARRTLAGHALLAALILVVAFLGWSALQSARTTAPLPPGSVPEASPAAQARPRTGEPPSTAMRDDARNAAAEPSRSATADDKGSPGSSVSHDQQLVGQPGEVDHGAHAKQQPSESGAAAPASPRESSRPNEPSSPVPTEENASSPAQNAIPEDGEEGREAAKKAEETDRTEGDGHATPTEASSDSASQTENPSEATTAAESEPGRTVLEQERYAIQLVSFHSRSSVAPFVEKFEISDTALFTKSRGGDRDWYLVFAALYPTRSEASAAVEALPPRLKELEPWIRKLPIGTALSTYEALGNR
jgi:hypothetical protein